MQNYNHNSTVNMSSSRQNSIDFLSNDTLSTTYPALLLFDGKVDPKFLERINPFWLNFNAPSPIVHYIIATIYIIILTIGCLGNALVIFMFIKCKSLRKTSVLIINLGISDFFMLAKSPVAIYNSFKLGPALGDWGCRLYGFVGGLTGTASIITLTAISIDRYYVIIHPLSNKRSFAGLKLKFCVIWLYAFIFSSIPALNIGLSEYVPEGLLTTCSFDYLSKSSESRVFMFLFFLFAWFLPFLTITFCYYHIIKTVKNSNKIQSTQDTNKNEKKLTKIVICIIILWFSAWTPYSIVALLGISGNEKYLTPTISMIPAIFCKISACINPYIYALTHPRFRVEVYKLLFKRVISNKYQTTQRTLTTRNSADDKVINIDLNLKDQKETTRNSSTTIITKAIIEPQNEKATGSLQQINEQNVVDEISFIETEAGKF